MGTELGGLGLYKDEGDIPRRRSITLYSLTSHPAIYTTGWAKIVGVLQTPGS